jgi:hypothetical protein
LAIIASSCSFYKPLTLTAPVLEEKGELHVGGNLGSSADAYLVYSPLKYLFTKVQYGSSYSITYDSEQNGVQESIKVRNNSFEAGIGYYNKIVPAVRYQLFAGYARGNSGASFDDFVLSSDLDNSGVYGAEYDNRFIQSTLHFDLRNNLFLGLTGRLNFLEFSNFKSRSDSIGYVLFFPVPIQEDIYDFEDRQKLAYQFAIDLTLKKKEYGLFTQLHFAGSNEESDDFSVRGLGIHFGLFMRIDAFFKTD